MNIYSKETFYEYCKNRIPKFHQFTDIQEQAFGNPEFWDSNRSIFVTATTAAGKSLVAFGAMAQSREGRRLKSIYIVPFRSLAVQKYEEICSFFAPDATEAELRESGVFISTSEYSNDDADIINGKAEIVVTIYEKFLLFINHNDNFLSQYDVVIMDEFGIVSNAERGLKVDFAFMHCLDHPHIRLMALSTPFYCWDEYLNCGDFLKLRCDTRPHELEHHHCFVKPWMDYITEEAYIYDLDKYIDPSVVRTREDLIAYICANEYGKGNSVLIFCHSRNRTRSLVNQIYRFFIQHDVLDPIDRMDAEDEFNQIYDQVGISYGDLYGLFEDDEGQNSDLICNLKSAFLCGITFHNASLPYKLRTEIEERLFKTREMQIVVATDTLAYGINSNVSTVIIDARQTDLEDMFTQYEYLNYCGRAGRHEKGYVYTLYRSEEEYEQMKSVIEGSYQHLSSSILTLAPDNDRAFYLLTMLGKNSYTMDKLCEMIQKFPNGVQNDSAAIQDFVKECTDQLLACSLAKYEDSFDSLDSFDSFDSFDNNKHFLQSTELGRAVCGYIVRLSEFKALRDFAKAFDDSSTLYPFDYFNMIASLANFRSSLYFHSEDDNTVSHVLTQVLGLSNTDLVSSETSSDINRFCQVTIWNGRQLGTISNSPDCPFTFESLRQALVLTRIMQGDEIEEIYHVGLITVATVNAMISKYSYYTDLLQCLAKYYGKPRLASTLNAISTGLNIGGVPYRLILALSASQIAELNANDGDALKLMYRTIRLMNLQRQSQAQQQRIRENRAKIENLTREYRDIWNTLLTANHTERIT